MTAWFSTERVRTLPLTHTVRVGHGQRRALLYIPFAAVDRSTTGTTTMNDVDPASTIHLVSTRRVVASAAAATTHLYRPDIDIADRLFDTDR